jgi:putative Mn2+ efflux pump MntP
MFIAVSICIISIRYLEKNNNNKMFIMMILVASTIHSSALVFILLLALSKIKLTDKVVIFYSILCIALFFLSNIAFMVIGMMSPYYFNKYIQNVGSGSGKGMLLLLSLIYIMCYFTNKNHNDNLTLDKITVDRHENTYDYNEIWLKMLMIAIAFNILALRLEIAARIMWYFKIGLIYLIPNTVSNVQINVKLRNTIMVFGIITFIAIPVVYYTNSIRIDNFGINPYKFYWQ